MPALPSPILVDGDGTGPRNWTSQSFEFIDEGIAAFDSVVIRAANPSSGNRNTTLVTSYTLANMPVDFTSMTALSWQTRYRANVNTGDDTLTFSLRIVAGATILAAANSGGTFQTIRTGVNTTWPGTSEISPVTAFTYVNTTATKAQWDSAELELASQQSVTMSADDNTILMDTIEFTGFYDSGATPTFGIPARPAVARPFAPLLTL